MKTYTPQRIGFYTRSLKHCLSKNATKAATYKVLIMLSYLLIAICLLTGIGSTEKYVSVCLISIPVGILYASIFTYCHELSHGTILKNRTLMYLAEIVFWSVNYMPATMWRKIHNSNHHINVNNYKDPDRRTFKSERNKYSFVYNLFCYPNRLLRYSLTVGFAMIFYTWKHIISVFYRTGKKPSIVTYKPHYSSHEKKLVLLELVFILAYQIIVYFITGTLIKYLIFSLISYYVSSAILISLIITQHLINPHFKEFSDPVINSTSIILPRFLDFLVDYHSYHTEHHIFPGINFDYYPIVSKELQKTFPDIYNRERFISAIKKAYSYEILIDDPLE